MAFSFKVIYYLKAAKEKHPTIICGMLFYITLFPNL